MDYVDSLSKEYIGPTMTLGEMVLLLLDTAIAFAGLVSIFYLIYGGIRYMSSKGDKEKAEKAKKGLIDAIIGLIICLVSVFVVNFALKLFGVSFDATSSALSLIA